MDKHQKQLTLHDVARACGVSPSTVSRAFSRPTMVKPDVRERVLAVAAELGYRPNRIARSLATGKLGVIGLVVTDITNPFYPPLVRAVQHAAVDRDWTVLLLDAEELGREEPALIDWVRQQVDGLLLASPRTDDDLLADLLDGLPTVVLNREFPALPCVRVDNTAALAQAGEELRRLGHRRIALLRGPERSRAAEYRAAAVLEWAAGTDMEILDLGAHPSTFEAGQDAGRSLAETDATAVFAFDDLTAAGVLAGLTEAGVPVPEAMSIVGCDDVLLARTLTPTLTTITAPMEALGERAVALLEAAMRGEDATVERLPGVLALRGSIAPAR